MRIEELKWNDWTAKINVSRGGNCIGLRDTKHNCMILREPDYEKGLDNPYLYGMPILFPVNRISGGKFEFEGRIYEFPINEPATNCFLHGTLHETEFQVLEKEEHRILLSYAAKKNEYHKFPHAFEIRMEYVLQENGMIHKTEIRNLSEENMPVFLGFHTTFQLPFAEGSTLEDLCIKVNIADEFERNMGNYLPTGRILSHDKVTQNLIQGKFVPSQKLSRHYRTEGNGVMSVTDLKNGITVVYKNDSKFGYRLIYGEGTSFICLEPQNCLANCPNAPFERKDSGFKYLAPGEKVNYESEIILLTDNKQEFSQPL